MRSVRRLIRDRPWCCAQCFVPAAFHTDAKAHDTFHEPAVGLAPSPVKAKILKAFERNHGSGGPTTGRADDWCALQSSAHIAGEQRQ